MKVEIGDATLYLGDCAEILPTIKADMAFTSPPYNMRTRVRNGQYTEREKSEHFSKKYGIKITKDTNTGTSPKYFLYKS